jgi:hypothetical protein
MNNRFSKSLLIALAVGVSLSLPWLTQGQSTNKPAQKKAASSEQKDAPTKKPAHPFRGKLAAIDKTAKTITVGKSVYHITSETKIKRGDKPAILEDGVIGEQVTGYAKPMDDGGQFASTLYFGSKSEGKATAKKSEEKKKP